MKYLMKVFILLKKLNNPPFFYYSVYHYLKKYVKTDKAKKICFSNFNSYSSDENEFIVSTYDGSNQCVHPDIVYFNNEYWFVITPYPYGMEEYENPCLYHGNAMDSLAAISNNPIKRQRKHDIGFHLSDPCLFEYKGKLICAYRENTRNNGVETSYIHYKMMDMNMEWSVSQEITRSDNDPILSPAFYVEEIDNLEKVYMVHVCFKGNNSHLVLSPLSETLKIESSSVIECTNIPEGYYIWHIAVAYGNGEKKGRKEDKKYGLFLIRNKTHANRFKLCLAEFSRNEIWKIEREINIPQLIIMNQLHPYKSCFIPSTNQLIYSYVDKKNRYRMTIADL